jgi:carboxymethylenebutenolidase
MARIGAAPTKLGKVHELVAYDKAGHSVFATDRADYRPLAAQDGWAKIFAWYEKYLG